MKPGLAAAACAAFAVALLLSCASAPKPTNVGTPSAAERGFRVLDAVVVDRLYEPPGTAGTSLGGPGNWYLDFEAKDGEATVHYHFPVTRQQYYRYVEGTHVQLVLADDRLREIRPVP